MLVADDSGVCTAVFWNEMCPKFYHRYTYELTYYISFCYKVFFFSQQNSAKNLDPSYKMDLDI